jgi:hypothetical protein
MAKITFSDENQSGDIPTFEINKEELLDISTTKVNDLLYTREGKVVVCFQNWEDSEWENQYKDFLISENDIVIEDFIITSITNIPNDLINFNFFCFHKYEDAFGYCMDLKEGL